MKLYFSIPLLLVFCMASNGQNLTNTQADGYKGIWFELNQKFEYGDKYAGGLGTYTAKHRPMAIYAGEVNKTFFVYGGTTKENKRHLLAMVGAFDHSSGMVSKPTVAWDKITVNDPHDNPSISIDNDGFIWIFVSGRGTKREGIKLKSDHAYDIGSFHVISKEEFTYPQIWKTGSGFFHFFTKYSGIRELYFETSVDGESWSEDIKLAGIKNPEYDYSGHYQLSAVYEEGEITGTFFNRHINGHPDTRTDLYYLQTKDSGKSWSDAFGTPIDLPVSDVGSPARVVDYAAQKQNVYMKDMAYDGDGNPVCLYLTSAGHEPGPANAPYTWKLTFLRNQVWHSAEVCQSDHNYDMGSLYLSDSVWMVVAPTEDPPQPNGVGGEIAIWKSKDLGISWSKAFQVTHESPLNHSYIRRPENFKAPFCFFWATGDPHEFSISNLYFGDFQGHIWELPYHMTRENEKPFQLPTNPFNPKQ